MIFRLWQTFHVHRTDLALSRSLTLRSIFAIPGSTFPGLRLTPKVGNLSNCRSFVQRTNMYSLKSSSFACTDFTEKLSEPEDKTNFTVVVEGNIGCGKSTLLKHFCESSSSSIEIIEEPLDKWTNLDGHNALGLLYEDPQRWSFSFNMYALLTRVQMHTKPQSQPVKMLERSLFSTNYCFVQSALLSNTINEYEHAVLNQWFQYLVAGKKANVDLIVYLRADPVICYDRLKKRSRQEEAGVPMGLIQSLHDLHDDWLLHKKFPLPAPVLVLDANPDLQTMKEVYNSRKQEILCGAC